MKSLQKLNKKHWFSFLDRNVKISSLNPRQNQKDTVIFLKSTISFEGGAGGGVGLGGPSFFTLESELGN